MRTALRIAGVILFASSVAAATADPAYVGKWKLNNAKSDFGQLTATYEAVPGGGFKATIDGLSYTFKADGKPVATPWGTMATWKAVNDTTWEVSNTANGKPFGNDTMKLSADGKTLTVDSKSPTGATSTSTFTRVSGGPGLAGTWKAAKMSTSAGVLENQRQGRRWCQPETGRHGRVVRRQARRQTEPGHRRGVPERLDLRLHEGRCERLHRRVQQGRQGDVLVDIHGISRRQDAD
jgi:hypothetical protein